MSPELVPRPLWGQSAYRLLTRKEWAAIRRDVLQEAAERCVICGERPEKGLTCHERWHYAAQTRIATLVGFERVCRSCSLVHHIGFAATVGLNAEPEARERLARVNDIGLGEADQLVADAYAAWGRRSGLTWQQRVLPDLAERYPALASLMRGED